MQKGGWLFFSCTVLFWLEIGAESNTLHLLCHSTPVCLGEVCCSCAYSNTFIDLEPHSILSLDCQLLMHFFFLIFAVRDTVCVSQGSLRNSLLKVLQVWRERTDPGIIES